MKLKTIFCVLSLILLIKTQVVAQDHSVARLWNEELLQSIRKDFARPTVHARNLFHMSAAMYDAWAVFDEEADPFFLGNTINGFFIPFNGFTPGSNIEAQRKEAISYTMYRLLLHRFKFSPEGAGAKARFDHLMDSLGYNKNFTSVNYSTGNPAALGNYIASRVIAFGLQDGSREANLYSNAYYAPVNKPLNIILPGNDSLLHPNRWQPITLGLFIDQSGNQLPITTPPFLSAEWGNVVPFALHDSTKTVYQRDGHNWNVYHDPGPPVYLDTTDVDTSRLYKETFGMVLQWSSHLGTEDGVLVDISPGAKGNTPYLPETPEDHSEFYHYMDGFTIGNGRPLNPITGQPYAPNLVKRGDFTRVLAEFWADGPQSETPPGHWYTILNYVNDQPSFLRKYRGSGDTIENLEWDVKSYFMLGGAMHDAAISTWGIKGYYDYVRPVSALRYMLQKGQCTDSLLSSYHPAGVNLIPGYVEIVSAGDSLAGAMGENIGKIKVKAWRGPNYIPDPETTVAGVGWILGEDWWPYQRPTFVTPPFGGYISGHSTYSRAAAEVLTTITGSEFFPNGLGTFTAEQNEYLVFEDGPSEDVILQWATYRDAADQSSLSRIWGGIHPPVDDIPGRKNGIKIAGNAVKKSEGYFFDDQDGDGYYTYNDCNDDDEFIHPGATEICDYVDNDCDEQTDENVLEVFYADADGDGFGSPQIDSMDCVVPLGYVANRGDCNDDDQEINPQAIENCDETDNNCNNQIDEGCGCTDPSAHNFNEEAVTDDGSCLTCFDGIKNGDEIGIDCGGNNCATCPPPTAVCGNIVTVYVESGDLVYNGPGNSDVYLIDAILLDNGSLFNGELISRQVKRKYTNVSFNWTTAGACLDATPNNVYNNIDKGLEFRDCLPIAPADFNKIRNFDMKIVDDFGSSTCDGRYKVIYNNNSNAPDFGLEEESYSYSECDNCPFFIYPNPGNNELIVSAQDGEMGHAVNVTLMDLMGKVWYTTNQIKEERLLHIDTDFLPEEMYYVVIKTNSDLIYYKWIKTKN